MTWIFQPALALGMILTLIAEGTAAQDEAKLRARIEALERDLARITSELQELRARVGGRQNELKTVELIKVLDHAYEKLQAEALDKELLIKADQAFARGDAQAALELLRRGRHPAGLPMILKEIVQREALPKFKKEDIAGHLLALALLTGEDVETIFLKQGSGHRLATTWWLPGRENLVTDIGKMTPAQVAHVARRLRDNLEPISAYKSNGPSYYANALLYKLVNYREDSPDRRGPPGWFVEELHPALGPVFLAGMGYRPEGAGGQDIVDVPYQLVHLLAALRKNGALPHLDKVAEDSSQNSGLRLVCLITLHGAGEGVRVPAVLSILAREKKLDRKLAALEFLYYADDLEPAADYLLEVLDDPGAEVRQSTLNALRKNPPPRLFKKLKELADNKHQERLLEVIAAMGTIETQQYLADYLANAMQDRPKTERIHDALWAFQHAVNQHWLSAGRYQFDYYHRLATKALQWWKENRGDRK